MLSGVNSLTAGTDTAALASVALTPPLLAAGVIIHIQPIEPNEFDTPKLKKWLPDSLTNLDHDSHLSSIHLAPFRQCSIALM